MARNANTSEFYERYWQRLGRAISKRGFSVEQRKALLQAALNGLPYGASVLDAGCGHGEFAAFLLNLGFAVTGVDISATAIAKAKHRCPGMRFEVASLEVALPFADEEFAAVWCSELLEHLFDVHRALAELNRVLQPRGKLVLTTPYHGLLKNIAIALVGFEKHYNPYLSHIRFFTRRSLAMCLDRAGFTVERWRGVGRWWPLWKLHFVIARKVGPPGLPPEIEG
jgi:2-polyprenyl-6-hydroxyphenyl methylase/3-demethylubiquinone-9 3-methyltransferase